MGATLRKLSPKATPNLEAIQPSQAKMGLSQTQSLYEAAWSTREQKEDLLSYYIPHLETLSDREIKGELRYWTRRLKGVPYQKGSKPYNFIVWVLGTPTYTDPRQRTFSSADRGDIQRACISLRGLIVPWFRVRTGPKPIESEKRIAMAKCVSQYLGLNSDWRLVMYITGNLGSKDYDGNWMNFLTRYYPIARVSGEDRFWFRDVQRQDSRNIVRELNQRPYSLRLDQVADFKRRVGLTAVDLWDGVQKNLFPIMPLLPWTGEAIQEHLFGMPILPPWEGDASQETLF